MTKPVAYLVNGVAFNDINRAKFYSDVLKYHKKIAVESLVPIPLYTAEQLYPIAEMTQEEFDEFEMARNEYENPSFFIYYLASLDSERKKFKKLFSWIYKNEHGKDLECELLFHKLWVDYELEKRGGAVKIVPNMKWFVVSKEKLDENYLVLLDSEKNVLNGHKFGIFYGSVKNYIEAAKRGMKFETKEEAEYSVQPFSEAVQLPVEGE